MVLCLIVALIVATVLLIVSLVGLIAVLVAFLVALVAIVVRVFIVRDDPDFVRHERRPAVPHAGQHEASACRTIDECPEEEAKAESREEAASEC